MNTLILFAHMHETTAPFWKGWLLTALALVLGFGVVEAVALFRIRSKKTEDGDYNGGTLSEYVWRWMREGRVQRVVVTSIVVLLVPLAVWLAVHFAFLGSVW